MAKSTKKPIDLSSKKDDILRYTRHGYTAGIISMILGIDEKELDVFFKKDDAFSRECKAARFITDVEVEESLLKRAKGYETIEEHTSEIPEKAGEGALKTKEVKQVKKFVPPDPTSALAWLHNRRMERWSKNPSQTNDLTESETSRLRRLAAIEADENM
jgi:hypothetical protein